MCLASITGRFLLLLAMHVAAGSIVAQWTPAANAVKLADSLIFTSTTANNHATVVWHPLRQRYYSLRIGGINFPLETWVAGSSTSVCVATTAIDTRGMWYNPNNGFIERNCLGTIGWASFGIDAASCATGTASIIFPGQLQATGQSCAAYDPVLDQVLSYAAATTSVQFRSRATGTIAQTLLLSGTSFATVNTESIIWTGQAGYEIGLLDWSNKRVLLFNRATGAFAGQSQLPASANTHNQFRFCYTNNRVWLYTSSLRKWNAYCIWNVATCPNLMLPVELLGVSAECVPSGASVTWSTGSETNSSHFHVERSTDMEAWTDLGRVAAAGHSQQRIDYQFLDRSPADDPVLYYRVREVDLDGSEQLGPVVPLNSCGKDRHLLRIHPNPANDAARVSVSALDPEDAGWMLRLYDATGRVVLQADMYAPATELDLHGLDIGTYVLALFDAAGEPIDRVRLVKQ